MQKSKIDSLVAEYGQIRPRYVEFCNRTSALLDSLLQHAGIRIHTIESRAKTVNSFRDKLIRPGKSYPNPLRDMPDLVGVRAILYQPKEVQRAVNLIGSEFKVDSEQSSDSLDRLAANQFGYRSVHLVCKLNNRRRDLAEWAPFTSFQIEFQIRTVLQHAWAGMSHELQYKNEAATPDKLKRRLFRLSGLLELADEEFSNLTDSHKQLVANVSESTDAEISEYSVNKITLAEFVERSKLVKSAWNAALRAGFKQVTETEHDWSPGEDFSELATMCELVEIETLSDLKTAIEMPATKRNKYLKDILAAGGHGHWFAPPAFVVLLLLIRSRYEKLSVDKLREFGWSEGIAKAVLNVARSTYSAKPPSRRKTKGKAK